MGPWVGDGGGLLSGRELEESDTPCTCTCSPRKTRDTIIVMSDQWWGVGGWLLPVSHSLTHHALALWLEMPATILPAQKRHIYHSEKRLCTGDCSKVDIYHALFIIERPKYWC